MLLAHILLAVASLGLATLSALRPQTHKTMLASVISFVAATASGILLQATHNGVSLHGVSMLATFSIIYGIILRLALRKQTTQTQK